MKEFQAGIAYKHEVTDRLLLAPLDRTGNDWYESKLGLQLVNTIHVNCSPVLQYKKLPSFFEYFLILFGVIVK